MIEIPEAFTLARQINETLAGRVVQSAIAAASPHKFAWYHGDPAEYPARLQGSTLLSSEAHGGQVQITLSRASLVFSDGVNLRFIASGEPCPSKHQLLLVMDDGSALAASVQMYGGLLCWLKDETLENPYYRVAREKPSPLSAAFTEDYFAGILAIESVQKLSVKAALATEQRIPGLGNGVLQDILWNAGLSPRCRAGTLRPFEIQRLFTALKDTLAEMTRLGGRDTEKDLFGNPGGYQTVMSSRNSGAPCPVCGTAIVKEAYMGGSVYYCPACQRT